jgi:hypothetical protein
MIGLSTLEFVFISGSIENRERDDDFFSQFFYSQFFLLLLPFNVSRIIYFCGSFMLMVRWKKFLFLFLIACQLFNSLTYSIHSLIPVKLKRIVQVVWDHLLSVLYVMCTMWVSEWSGRGCMKCGMNDVSFGIFSSSLFLSLK